VAAPGWRTDRALENELFQSGFNFEFFQAVRLLSRRNRTRKPVGRTAKPSEEIARFGARLSMGFPASAIHDIEHSDNPSDPPRVTVAFLSLTGTQGVLPFDYTDRLLARKVAKDSTLAAFFDLFNHRFVSLFYRAWEKHRAPILYEAGLLRHERPDTFTHSLFDLIGLGTHGLLGRMKVPDENLLYWAGLIAQRPHSATALRSILWGFLSVPVEILQNLGSWYGLDDPECSYLSEELPRNQLGEGAVIGDEVWDQQTRFRISVGPIGLSRFIDFLPDGPAMRQLEEVTKFLVGEAIAFDVQVILGAAEVPYCRLYDDATDAPRLGWMGWLKTESFAMDANDAIFALAG